MSEEEYELWFDKDLKRDDFLEAESEDYENEERSFKNDNCICNTISY